MFGGAILLAGSFSAGTAYSDPAPPVTSYRSADRRLSLGIKGSQFTLNGEPAFLIGISYYAGLGAPDDVLAQDLRSIKLHGFQWVRVWATWDGYENDISAVDGSGNAREPYLGKLKSLVAECAKDGLIVDVTVTRGNGAAPHLATLEDLRRAEETIVRALKPFANWYLDLANERNVGDKRFVSFDELKDLREAVRALDPARLVTASSGSDIDREELRKYLFVAKVDFICPHRPRDPGSAGQTEAKTRELLQWMEELGRIVPVHYQEPFRRGYTKWQPAAEDFAADLKAARAGGAAGWCFHNGGTRGVKDGRPRRSFDLRDGSLFKQLDVEEHKFVEMVWEQ